MVQASLLFFIVVFLNKVLMSVKYTVCYKQKNDVGNCSGCLVIFFQARIRHAVSSRSAGTTVASSIQEFALLHL